MDEFTKAYIDCALWSSTDDDGESLDRHYGITDFHPDAIKAMEADCQSFQIAHEDKIAGNLRRAGHDFWLTRQRHGAGYWDGDWAEDVGKVLTDAAHNYSEVDLWVGSDGKIHC